MDLSELNNLINIRQYTANSLNNNSIDKDTVRYLGGLLFLIDEKIITILRDSSFKEYVKYENVKDAINKVVQLNNIKSGLKK